MQIRNILFSARPNKKLLITVIFLFVQSSIASDMPDFTGKIDSYQKAHSFSDFLSQNTGNAVHFNITAERPFWAEMDCGFMLKMPDPEDDGIEPESYAMGEQYCIEDCRGSYSSTNTNGVFNLTMSETTVLFEGLFIPMGDVDHAHQGIYSVGLRPVNFAHEKTDGTLTECH